MEPKILTLKNTFLRIAKTLKPQADIWLIHGFGESGLCYKEVFNSRLGSEYNLFVPDLPGFGVSPFNPKISSMREASQLLEGLIRKLSQSRPLVIVGHSMGGIIGTAVARKLLRQTLAYINIEGNLTYADTFYSGLAVKANSGERFKNILLEKIAKSANGDEALLRYCASLRFAHPQALLTFGKSCFQATGKHASGNEYLKLRCKKIYLWGEKSVPELSRQFIRENDLANKRFASCGHWPMIDKPKEFYNWVHNFLASRAAK